MSAPNKRDTIDGFFSLIKPERAVPGLGAEDEGGLDEVPTCFRGISFIMSGLGLGFVTGRCWLRISRLWWRMSAVFSVVSVNKAFPSFQ
jgi:hypothetical protein